MRFANAHATGRYAKASGGRKHAGWVAAALVGLLLGFALLLTGCLGLEIIGVTYDTGIEAGPAYTIGVEVEVPNDATTNARGTLALRYPTGWEVTGATYSGDQNGTVAEAAAIENYFSTTWEDTTVNDTHNGPKPGYEWWAGYTDAYMPNQGDTFTVTLAIDTHGTAGTFYFDVVTGVADETSPEDPGSNLGGAAWELGSAQLDNTVTLLAAQDPSVTSTTPAEGASSVAVGVVPRIVFSEAMDDSTLAAGNVYVRETGGGSPLSATNSYNTTTKTVLINLDSDLDYDTDYVIFVDAAAADTVGYTLGTDYIVSFHTAAEAVAPQVQSVSPANGATGVPLGSTVSAVFDQDMDAATLSGASFKLERTAGGSAVAASITYNPGQKKVILTPTSALSPETEYRATLTGAIQGDNGLGLAGTPYTWTFTTGSAAISFTDVQPGDDYYTAIQGMANLGIVNGYLDGTFQPINPIRRAHFAKMIVGAMGVAVDESMSATPPFTDMAQLVDSPTDLYPHQFVAAAYANNITKGTTPTTFSPYIRITRAQVVTMVVRALQNLYPGELDAVPSGYAATWGSFSVDHGENARIAQSNGLLAGLSLSGASSDPWGYMSRGEVAQVLWNMMMLLE